MKRSFLIFVVVMMLVGTVQAQEIPQPVSDAIAHMNEQLGTTYTANDFNWRWQETLFYNETLGCGWMADERLSIREIPGHIVQMDVPGQAMWEYRISYTPELAIKCEPVPDPMPMHHSEPPPMLIPENTNCNADLEARMLVEAQGRVVQGIGEVNVRDAPLKAAASRGRIQSGDTFWVLQGPVCNDDLTWWQVRREPFGGWVAEGLNSYWLEPEFAAFDMLTAESISNLQLLKQYAFRGDTASQVVFEVEQPHWFYASNEQEIFRYTFRDDFPTIDTLEWEIAQQQLESDDSILGLQTYDDLVLKVAQSTEVEGTVTGYYVRYNMYAGVAWQKMAFNPANTDIVAYTVEGELIAHPPGGTQVLNHELPGTVYDMQFTPDGRYFSAWIDDEILTWNTTRVWSVVGEVRVDDDAETRAIELSNTHAAINIGEEVIVVSLSGQFAPDELHIALSDTINDMAFTPDGSLLVMASEDALYTAPIVDSNQAVVAERIGNLEGGIVYQMQVSPSGQWLVFVTATDLQVWGAPR